MNRLKFVIMNIVLLMVNSFGNPMCIDKDNGNPFEENRMNIYVNVSHGPEELIKSNSSIEKYAALFVKLLAVISIPFGILILLNRSIVVNAVKTRADAEQRINDELSLEISKSLIMIRTLQEKNTFFNVEHLSRVSRIIGSIRKYSFQTRSDIASGIVFIDEFYKGLVNECKTNEKQLLTFKIADLAFDYLGFISYQAKNEVAISTINFKNILLYCGFLTSKSSIKHPLMFGPFKNYLTQSNLWIFSRVAVSQDDFLAIEVLEYLKCQFHVLNALKYHKIYIPLIFETTYQSLSEDEMLKFELFRFEVISETITNRKTIKGHYSLNVKNCIIGEVQIEKILTSRDCLLETNNIPKHISKWKKIVHPSFFEKGANMQKPKTPLICFEFEYLDCIKMYEKNKRSINKMLERIEVG